MDDAEHRGVDADAEGEGQERGERDPTLRGEPPRREADVLKQQVHWMRQGSSAAMREPGNPLPVKLLARPEHREDSHAAWRV